jgi:proline iminopeptidase
MKKALIIGGLVLLALAVAAAAFTWYFMGRPLYEPGKLSLSAALAPPPQPGGDGGWLVAPGITLHHFAHGAGRKILVVHGGPGRPFQRPVPGIEPLSDRHTFEYYDQRGCGRSTRPIDRFESDNYYGNMQRLEATLGLGAQIADIERIRRILGEEKLILLGHSFGAFLASMYAAEFPDRVAALLLVAPASVLLMPSEDGGLFEEVAGLLPQALKEEYAGYLKRYLDFSNIFSKSDAELAALNAGFGKYYRIAAEARGFSMPEDYDPAAEGGWMVQAMYFSMGQRHDYRPALRRVTAPVLVIHGGKDIQPERSSRVYSEAFPRSTFRMIENAGHFPFFDQPAAFVAAIGEFLAAVN